MVDYHIALRIDDGMLVFAQLVRVCRVMVCLNQRYRTYPKAIMMQLVTAVGALTGTYVSSLKKIARAEREKLRNTLSRKMRILI